MAADGKASASEATGRPTAPPPEPEDPQEVLARERGERVRGVVACALGAILPLAGIAATAAISRDAPDADSEAASLRFADQHTTELLVATIVLALGFAAIAVALAQLFRMTRARNPAAPRVALYMAVAGAIAMALGAIALQIVVSSVAGDLAERAVQTDRVAEDLVEDSPLAIPVALRVGGTLAIAFGFVMISLHAMRVGLLTRFMGILGIIVGALFVLPLGSQLPIVQSFWFGALAVLFAHRWPSGMPPAWESGKAEPWPSQQELREQRAARLEERERDEDNGGDETPDAGEGEAAAASAPVKRKRKRRR